MSYAITDGEFRSRIAAFNREEGRAPRQETPKLVTGLDTPRKQPIEWLDMSNWDSEPIPERQWAFKDRVPLNQAGLFSGEGGTGKTFSSL